MRKKTPKISHHFKPLVKAHGDFVLDYSESARKVNAPCWYVGRGEVAGNTVPIPSGLHQTPRQAWRAAAVALGLVAPKGARL